MKTLRITTYWTVEEADTIRQFLDDFQSAIWEGYGDDIKQMYREFGDEQLAKRAKQAKQETFFDEIPF